MIDGIKIYTLITAEEAHSLISKFEFYVGSVSLKTGDVPTYKIKTKYRDFTITIVAGKHLTLQGSLHKSFNDGINHNSFPYTSLVYAIDTLAAEIGISANRFTIQNMEAGVNITTTTLSSATIIRNLITYKGQQFSDYRIGKIVFGKCVKLQRYSLKIYNKGIQEQLPFTVIRAELRISKAMHLKQHTGIGTLADLKDKGSLVKLGAMQAKHFANILMNNVAAVQYGELSAEQKEYYLLGCNPIYWQNLGGSTTHNRRRFQKIITDCGGGNLTEVLVVLVAEEWNLLLSG
jgi:hypothetical protein